MRLVMSASCAIALGAGLPQLAHATENYQWSSPTGFLYFGAGILPPHTEYGAIGIRSVFAQNSNLYDQSGHTVDNKFNQTVNVTTPSYIYMSNYKILGATWGFLIAQPIETLNGSIYVNTPAGRKKVTGNISGPANTDLEPFLLQWHVGGLFVATGVMVQLPDGEYSTKNLFNPSTNYWTFGPHVGATYITQTGQELSSQVQINFNTTNEATHYHTGAELEMEWAAGQHLGDFTFGPVGTIYQQIQDDSGPSLTGTVRSRVFSAGLSLNYMRRDSPFSIQATVTKDFGAESHTEGASGALRASWLF